MAPSRLPAPPAAAAAGTASEDEVMLAHYGADSEMDTIFYAFYLIMLIATFKMNPPKLQGPLAAAIVMCMAGLSVRVCSRQAYQRCSPSIVLAAQFGFLTLRAICVWRMQGEQAVHWRTNKDRADPLGDTAFPYLVSMCNTAGGLLRVFEVLGLQQPLRRHVLLLPWQLALQLYACMVGFRMGYSNGLFYSAHEAHDSVANVAAALLEALVPLPLSPQAACSSCPGVAVYLTVFTFTSVAVPLYLSHLVDQAARRRCQRRVTARLAAAAATADQLTQQQQQQQQLRQQQLGQSSAAAAAGLLPVLTHESADQQHQQQQQQLRTTYSQVAPASVSQGAGGSLHSGGAADGSEQQWKAALQAAEADASLGSYLGAWAVHILAVAGMLLLCWVLSEVVALLLLPKLLSSEQLAYWCPNKPLIPFKIAVEVYDYIA